MQYVRYAPCQVTLNSISLCVDPDTEKWDIDEEGLRIRWTNTNSIQIYSKGVYVKSLSYHQYGFDAVVLAKENMTVNMARNKVNVQDAMWIRIRSHLKARARRIAKRKGRSGRTDAGTRRSMIRLFLSGEMDASDIDNVTILKNSSGRSHSLYAVFISKENIPLTVCPDKNSRVAETIARQGRAYILDPVVLEEFGVKTLDELLKVIIDALWIYYDEKPSLRRSYIDRIYNKITVRFEILAATVLTESALLPDKKYTNRQRAARNALQHGSNLMARELTKALGKGVAKRKVLLGTGHAIAWTNGMDMVAFKRIPCGFWIPRAGQGGGSDGPDPFARIPA